MSQREAPWYALASKNPDCVVPESNWLAWFKETQKCSHSVHRRPEFWGSPINAVLKQLPDSTNIQEIEGTDIDIMNVQFLRFLGFFEAPTNIVLGTVQLSNGEPLDDWVTVVTPRLLELRGGPESVRRRCPGCSCFLYFPMPFEYEYVFVGDLIEGQQFYLGAPNAFVIAQAVAKRLGPAQRRHLRIKPIPEREQPEDGISDFPRTGI